MKETEDRFATFSSCHLKHGRLPPVVASWSSMRLALAAFVHYFFIRLMCIRPFSSCFPVLASFSKHILTCSCINRVYGHAVYMYYLQVPHGGAGGTEAQHRRFRVSISGLRPARRLGAPDGIQRDEIDSCTRLLPVYSQRCFIS